MTLQNYEKILRLQRNLRKYAEKVGKKLSLNHDLELKLELVHSRTTLSKFRSSLT